MQQYGSYRHVLVDDSDTTWHAHTVACLDRLEELPIGRKLFLDIAMGQHDVEIVPSDTGKNTCKSGGANEYERFVRLRQAFDQVGGKSVQTELTDALAKAAKAHVSRDFIASRLAVGLSPVTIHTDQNIGAPQGTSYSAQFRFPSAQNSGDRVAEARKLLDDLCSGELAYVPSDPWRMLPEKYKGSKVEKTHTIKDDLVRVLRSWLTPGDGTTCKVKFNPTGEYSCELDKSGTRRPPAIGLAHELCHAWRNVMGLRLFEDATRAGVDDDEVMTTGFPPYESERVSENMFRSQWRLELLQMRTDYDTYKVEKKTKDMILKQRKKK